MISHQKQSGANGHRVAVIVFPCDCPKWTLIFFYSLRLQSRHLPLPFPTFKPLPFPTSNPSIYLLLALSRIHDFFFLICCYVHVCICIYSLKYTDIACSVCIMSLGCMFSVWSILVLDRQCVCSSIFTAPFQREELRVQPHTAFLLLGFSLTYTRAIPPFAFGQDTGSCQD